MKQPSLTPREIILEALGLALAFGVLLVVLGALLSACGDPASTPTGPTYTPIPQNPTQTHTPEPDTPTPDLPTPTQATQVPTAAATPFGTLADELIDCAHSGEFTQCPTLFLDAKLVEPLRVLEEGEHVVLLDLLPLCVYYEGGYHWDLCASDDYGQAHLVCQVYTDEGQTGWLPCSENLFDQNVGLFPCIIEGDTCRPIDEVYGGTDGETN